jgi:hypothetical protein
MSGKERIRSLIVGLALLAAMLACDLPAGVPTATPTATPTGVAPAPSTVQGGSSNGTGGNSGGSNGGSQGGSNGGNNGGNNGGSVAATATQLADIGGGPYVVQQIETLGHEAISGFVCSLAQPFSVLSVTPEVTFSFVFVPIDEKHGNVTYAYSIPKAGESHQASGTYTLAPISQSSSLQLSLAVSDHVVFKGFDGNIPNRYKFNLVPNSDAPCKAP